MGKEGSQAAWGSGGICKGRKRRKRRGRQHRKRGERAKPKARHLKPLPTLIRSVSGVILELGPGLVHQVVLYDRAKVTRIVGVELDPLFIPHLRAEITRCELDDVYEIIESGIEDGESALERARIVPGSVDTIIIKNALCSVDDAREAAKSLYALLRPGGRLIFSEHHRSDDFLTRMVQHLWNPLWRALTGGCNLTRDIRTIVLEAGEWENVESINEDALSRERPWVLFPRVYGALVKPGRK